MSRFCSSVRNGADWILFIASDIAPGKIICSVQTKYVARALGRLLRIWKRLDTDEPQWRLLILLHSEEDIACFRSEIPCVTYLLPWLSPHGILAEGASQMRVVPPLLRQQLQPLETVLSMPPPPEST